MLKNPFEPPTPLEKAYLREMVEVASQCYQRGWVWGTAGNFSLRLRPGIVWQSPSGVCKGLLNPSAFVAVAEDSGQPLLGSSELYGVFPSEEMPIHLGIYERVPEASCVVHAHSPEVVRKSREASLRFAQEEMQKVIGSASFAEELILQVAPNQSRATIMKFRANMDEFMNRRAQMVILAGHGVYAWGRDPRAALARIEALEFLCANSIN